MKRNLVICSGCDKKIDLRDMVFIDSDEMPIVLDVQLRGEPTERKAINFTIKHHDVNELDYGQDPDGKLHMSHYERVGKLSHEEVGDDVHLLEFEPRGYWSYQ